MHRSGKGAAPQAIRCSLDGAETFPGPPPGSPRHSSRLAPVWVCVTVTLGTRSGSYVATTPPEPRLTADAIDREPRWLLGFGAIAFVQVVPDLTPNKVPGTRVQSHATEHAAIVGEQVRIGALVVRLAPELADLDGLKLEP